MLAHSALHSCRWQLLVYLKDTKQPILQVKANVRFWVSCVRKWNGRCRSTGAPVIYARTSRTWKPSDDLEPIAAHGFGRGTLTGES
jgi:hypothetical protein